MTTKHPQLISLNAAVQEFNDTCAALERHGLVLEPTGNEESVSMRTAKGPCYVSVLLGTVALHGTREYSVEVSLFDRDQLVMGTSFTTGAPPERVMECEIFPDDPKAWNTAFPMRGDMRHNIPMPFAQVALPDLLRRIAFFCRTQARR